MIHVNVIISTWLMFSTLGFSVYKLKGFHELVSHMNCDIPQCTNDISPIY